MLLLLFFSLLPERDARFGLHGLLRSLLLDGHIVYENLSYILTFPNPNLQVQARHKCMVREHPKIYLQARNCMDSKALAWHLFAFHTSQPYSKLGRNTAMFLNPRNNYAKPGRDHLASAYYALLRIYYAYPMTHHY